MVHLPPSTSFTRIPAGLCSFASYHVPFSQGRTHLERGGAPSRPAQFPPQKEGLLLRPERSAGKGTALMIKTFTPKLIFHRLFLKKSETNKVGLTGSMPAGSDTHSSSIYVTKRGLVREGGLVGGGKPL